MIYSISECNCNRVYGNVATYHTTSQGLYSQCLIPTPRLQSTRNASSFRLLETESPLKNTHTHTKTKKLKHRQNISAVLERGSHHISHLTRQNNHHKQLPVAHGTHHDVITYITHPQCTLSSHCVFNEVSEGARSRLLASLSQFTNMRWNTSLGNRTSGAHGPVSLDAEYCRSESCLSDIDINHYLFFLFLFYYDMLRFCGFFDIRGKNDVVFAVDWLLYGRCNDVTDVNHIHCFI